MSTQPKRTESKAAGAAPLPAKHKVPDPPDPDNLPIDYPGTGKDAGVSTHSFAKGRRGRHLRPLPHS